MKRLLFVFVFIILALLFIGEGKDVMTVSSYEELIRGISSGMSQVGNFSDIAGEFIFYEEAIDIVASLPVK